MPQPFRVVTQDDPGTSLGTWDKFGNITIPGTLTAANVVGGSSGTVTSVTNVDGTIAVTGTAAAPVVSVSAATLASKAAAVHTHVESDVTSLVSDLALKAPLASPTLTGTATTSNLAINGTLTAGSTAIGVTTTTYLAANQTVNNSAAFVNLPGLSLAVVAGTYVFDGWLVWSSGTTPTISINLIFPAGTTAEWGLFSVVGSSGAFNASLSASTVSATYPGAGAGAGTSVVGRPGGSVVVTTPGTVQFQFAQGTANASNTVVNRGSFIRWTRVA